MNARRNAGSRRPRLLASIVAFWSARTCWRLLLSVCRADPAVRREVRACGRMLDEKHACGTCEGKVPATSKTTAVGKRRLVLQKQNEKEEEKKRLAGKQKKDMIDELKGLILKNHS